MDKTGPRRPIHRLRARAFRLLEPNRKGEGWPNYHEPVPAAVFRATLLKTLLALPPSVVMALMHTTTISASITAYSTAVGPSSRLRKSAVNRASLLMVLSLS